MLFQISSLQSQLMKYEQEGSKKMGMENNTIRSNVEIELLLKFYVYTFVELI